MIARAVRTISALWLSLTARSRWQSSSIAIIGVVIFNLLPIENYIAITVTAFILVTSFITRIVLEPRGWRSTQWMTALAIILPHFLKYPTTLENLILILSIWAMASGLVGLLWSDKHG